MVIDAQELLLLVVVDDAFTSVTQSYRVGRLCCRALRLRVTM